MKQTLKTLLVISPGLLLCSCLARKTEMGALSSLVVAERLTVSADTVSIHVAERDSLVSVTESRTVCDESGEISISRDTAGQPVRIIWRKSGRSDSGRKEKAAADRWFAGLNATRQSEAVKEKARTTGKTVAEETIYDPPEWDKLLFPSMAIGIGLIFLLLRAIARKGGKDE